MSVATAIRIEVLPARLGDCLLVECERDGGPPWRMLVDGGPSDTWPLLQARLRRLPPTSRSIDVAVVTHIDSDHIGGMLPFVCSDLAHNVGDFWFNGRSHLPGRTTTRSVAQGESFGALLLAAGGGFAGSPVSLPRAGLPWNEAMAGGPFDTGVEAGFVEILVPDGPTVTVLSPTTKRLAALAATWTRTVEEARRGPGRETSPDILEPLDDLHEVAGRRTSKDSSISNGSSIALLIEHRGASVVLGGDAFGTVLGAALTGVARARGLETLHVDAFKLPHHGSQANVLRALVACAPAKHYIVSTNGDTFHHPDDPAIARVVTGAPTETTLWFNYRTPRTRRWGDPALTTRYGHRAVFPDSDHPDDGVVLELSPRP